MDPCEEQSKTISSVLYPSLSHLLFCLNFAESIVCKQAVDKSVVSLQHDLMGSRMGTLPQPGLGPLVPGLDPLKYSNTFKATVMSSVSKLLPQFNTKVSLPSRFLIAQMHCRMPCLAAGAQTRMIGSVMGQQRRQPASLCQLL